MKRKLQSAITMLMAMMLLVSFNSWGQNEQIHYFNFNENTPPQNTSWEQPIEATIGSGELIYTFTEAFSFAGTTVNGNPGEVNGGSFVPRGGADEVNNGEHFVLNVSTEGFSNILLSYATQRTATGFDTQTIEYTIDGTNWIFIEEFDDIPSSWGVREVDFSAISGANDNELFAVRIILDGATAAAGNNRFDNISIDGDAFGAVATPVISPNGGTFYNPVDVTITTATADATIHYSLIGDEGPWDLYIDPITVDETTTIWAYATADDLDDSNVAHAAFTFPDVVDVLNIADLRDQAQDGTVYRLTNEVVLTFQQDFRNNKFIEDGTAGIMIDDAPAGNFNPGVITTEYDIYDGITGIVGTLSEYGNMLQFVPVADPGAATSAGNVIDPLVITMDDFVNNFMDYQARLVKIDNVTFDVADGQQFANGEVYDFSDGDLVGEFRTTFFGVDYIGDPIPDEEISIIGLPNSRSEGDFLTARNWDDLVLPVVITEFPWLEDFEGEDFPPAGWTIDQLSTSDFGWELTGDAFEGENAAYHHDTNASHDSWLITPAIVLEEGVDYVLSFYEKNALMGWYGYSGVLVSAGSNEPGSDDFVEVYESGSSLPVYTMKEIILSDYAGETIYIAFVYQGTYVHRWFIDNVEIDIYTPPVLYTVTFEVEDEEGEPITDAVITLADMTNDAGDYVFEAPVGEHTYLVVAEGYDDVEGSIEVIDDDVTESVVLIEEEEIDAIIVTYTDGDIPTTHNTNVTLGSRAEEPGLLTVEIPEGKVVTGVDIEYSMTAHGGAWIGEQRSFLLCATNDATEDAVYSGVGNMAGTLDYERTGLDMANGLSGEVDFELHAFRTWTAWGEPQDSNTEYNYVVNNTWKLIVHYGDAPTEPIFAITPEDYDFGEVEVGLESVAQTFTISNAGPGMLEVHAPVLDNELDFTLEYDAEDFPAELEGDAVVEFHVVFNPQEEGELAGIVSIDFNTGEVQTATVDLMGEGIIRPAGSTCENPLVVTLPVEDYEDSTEAYGNDYSNTWVVPSSNYLSGNDFVAQFTLEEAMLLHGSVLSVANSWTGLFILADCPNAEDPAEVLQVVGSSTGGAFTDLLLDAGTYYAIVSNWPSPAFVDFTLNLSATAPPEEYMVTFHVMDIDTEDPVEGATIAISGFDALTTDADGMAMIELIEGSYMAEVAKEGYFMESVPFEVIDEAITVEVALTMETVDPTYVLLHYWHFNDEVIEGEEEDYLVVSDFSLVGQGEITYPGTGDGYVDFRSHRPADPVSNFNLRMGQEPDQGAVLRVRNPSDTRQLIIAAPSTGYEDLLVTFATTRTSNGAQEQEFYFTPDAGETWIMVGETYEVPELEDELGIYLHKEIDLSAYEEVNDNPDLHFKILAVGEGADNTSGNQRFDNFTVDGVEIVEEPIELALIFNQPYDHESNANSSFDTEEGLNFQVVDNFFELEDEIEKFAFYGITAKIIDDSWQPQTPDETEPFFVRFYEYMEDFVPNLEAPETGTYEVQLLDQFGDGWAGDWPSSGDLFHTLSVFVNGIVVLDEITMLDGTGPDIHTFEANAGDEISTVFTVDGLYAGECYYAIYDPSGNLIAEEGGTAENPGQSVPGNIEPGQVMGLEPDLDNPLYDLNVDAHVYDTGDLLFGSWPIYKFEVYFDAPVDLIDGWISTQIDADSGSGTWFLWLSSPEGDGLAYQYNLTEEKTTYSRDKISRAGIVEEGEFFTVRGALGHDMGFELWGGELADPPLCATNPNPADEAEGLNIHGSLSWTGDPITDGFKLYMGTLGGDWDLIDGDDLESATSFEFSGLDYATSYEWKVVPYNAAGDAEDCPVWTFTTMDDPVLVPPLLETFVGTPFPPVNWSRFSGILDEDTEMTPVTSFWTHHWFGNIVGAAGTQNSAHINMWGTKNHWLVTPPINLGDGGYQVEFDIALTPWIGTDQVNLGPDDYVAFVISRDGGETWSDANVLIDWDENDEILPTGNHITLDIADETGIVHFGIYGERPTGNDPDLRFYFTNFQVRIPPDAPLFLISDEDWDFGTVGLGEEASKTFTITNDGPGILTVDAPVIDVTDEFTLVYDAEDFPVDLEGDDTVSFEVIFAPETTGDKTAEVSISYNDGDDQTFVVELMGEGFERPAGSTCSNPLVVTLPVVDHQDNTEAFGNDYLGAMIVPTSSYLNGYDFVAQFTLEEPMLLNGSVAGSWTGLFILADCPNADSPAAVLASATGSSGGSFSEVLLEAGTYFAIVSTWPLPNFTDFTLNLSATVPPDEFTVTFHVMEDSADEAPIEGANIAISGFGNITTGADGMASIDLPNDTYTANITASGYVAQEMTFTVDGEDEDIEVHMMDIIQDPFNLEVVTEGLDEGQALFSWNNTEAEDFFEGFEGAFPPAGWHKMNPDGGTGWMQLDVGTTPLPGWNVGEAIAAPDGGDFMADASWQQGGTAHNDQWLVTPEMTAAEGFEFSFYLRYFPDSYDDNVDIRISTTAQDDVAAFDVIVDELFFTTGSSENWELYTYSITDFVNAGETFYVAFREHVDDNWNAGSGIMLDNVHYGAAKSRTIPEPLALDEITLEREFHRNLDYVYEPVTRAEKAFLGFSVYLNDDLVAAEIADTEYLFTDLPAGEHTAGVQSVYTTGSSDIVAIDFEITDEVETFEVTFEVDITQAVLEGQLMGFNPDTYHIFMTGSMLGWTEPGSPETEMTLISSDPWIYAMTLELLPGTYEYKYFSDFLGDGWDGGEWPGDPNRVVEVTGDMTFQDEFDVGDAPEYTVTFEVADTEGIAIENAVITFNGIENAAGDYVFEGVIPGIYAYEVVAGGYESASGEVTVTNDHVTVEVELEPEVSTGEPIDATLSIFPNPAREMLYIEHGSEITGVRVVDILGQVVYAGSSETRSYELNVSGFDPGVYFIQVTTLDGVITQRVQVSR